MKVLLPLVAAGVMLSVIATGCATNGQHGEASHLLAKAVWRALMDGRRESRAEVGWAVVQNARTGEILCAETTDSGCLRHAPPEPWCNCRIELGGLVLPFGVASALDFGVVSLNSPVDVSEKTVGGVTIHDNVFGRDSLTLAEIVKLSSNRGGAQLAMQMGREKTEKGLHAFGFAIDGSVSEKCNPDAQTAWMGMGYGVSANGLQIASAFSALANGGILYDAWGGTLGIYDYNPWGSSVGKRIPRKKMLFYGKDIVTERTCAMVVNMLRDAVGDSGTGRLAAVEGLDYFGKTATVRIRDGTIYSQSFRSIFAGCLPIENNLYTVLVVFEMPAPEEKFSTSLFLEESAKVDAGLVAAPVFAKIAKAIQSFMMPQ